MPYFHVDLLDGVVAVLLDDALRPLLELGDVAVLPPLLQVAVLVELPT